MGQRTAKVHTPVPNVIYDRINPFSRILFSYLQYPTAAMWDGVCEVVVSVGVREGEYGLLYIL